MSIHDTISKRIITHHIIQKHEAISASRLGCLINKHLATNFVECRNIMCSSRTRDHSSCIRASNLNRMTFSPVHRLNMKFTYKIAVYYFMIAQMSLKLLQAEFWSPWSFARMREHQNLTKLVWVELCKAATECL